MDGEKNQFSKRYVKASESRAHKQPENLERKQLFICRFFWLCAGGFGCIVCMTAGTPQERQKQANVLHCKLMSTLGTHQELQSKATASCITFVES